MKEKTKVLHGDREATVIVAAKSGWVTLKYKDDKTEKKVRVKEVALKNPPKVKEPKLPKDPDALDGRLIPADLTKYTVHDSKTVSGRKQVDVADETANKLREKSLDQVYAYTAKTLDEPEKELRAKYVKLNPGMQRMNLGNRLRAAFRAAEVVHAGMQRDKKAA